MHRISGWKIAKFTNDYFLNITGAEILEIYYKTTDKPVFMYDCKLIPHIHNLDAVQKDEDGSLMVILFIGACGVIVMRYLEDKLDIVSYTRDMNIDYASDTCSGRILQNITGEQKGILFDSFILRRREKLLDTLTGISLHSSEYQATICGIISDWI